MKAHKSEDEMLQIGNRVDVNEGDTYETVCTLIN